jgi:transcriptional regulator with XRE-family HTH domain
MVALGSYPRGPGLRLRLKAAHKSPPIERSHSPGVSDDYRIGRMVRDVRLARNLRQEDVAEQAGVDRHMVSRLERGLVGGMTVGSLRAISRALEMPSIVSLGWRSPEIDRLRDENHAALVESVGRALAAAEWEVVPEYTFSRYGERGAVDSLAWHAASRALFIGETKTHIWDLQDLLSTLDRKRRLVPELLRRERGWRAEAVGMVLVLPERSTHRHLIERHSATFRAAFPQRQLDVRRWLESPSGDLRGIWFLPNSHQTTTRKPAGGRTASKRGPTPGRTRPHLRIEPQQARIPPEDRS